MQLTRSQLGLLCIHTVVAACGLLLAGCAAAPAPNNTAVSTATSGQVAANNLPAIQETGADQVAAGAADILRLPELAAVALNGEPLRVVATTSIIGDIVAQVGGDSIALTTLMEPGQDPHSYKPGAQQLTAVVGADLIFVNGWNLEEGLVQDLETIGADVPLVPISAGIAPLTFDKGPDDEAAGPPRGGADPHVWFSIPNVVQWLANVEQVLSELDPAHAETFARNRAAYLVELKELEEYAVAQLATVPEAKRFLVTNHDALSYFAQEYGFEILGTVIPVASTVAEPSPSDLVGLIGAMDAQGVCAIFTETTVSNDLAEAVAAELDSCDDVQVLELYTGALGPAGSAADSYLSMFRANVDTIVGGLK